MLTRGSSLDTVFRVALGDRDLVKWRCEGIPCENEETVLYTS